MCKMLRPAGKGKGWILTAPASLCHGHGAAPGPGTVTFQPCARAALPVLPFQVLLCAPVARRKKLLPSSLFRFGLAARLITNFSFFAQQISSHFRNGKLKVQNCAPGPGGE